MYIYIYIYTRIYIYIYIYKHVLFIPNLPAAQDLTLTVADTTGQHLGVYNGRQGTKTCQP